MVTIIKDSEEILEIKKWMEEAKKEAKKSKCLKSQVGAVIVKEGKLFREVTIKLLSPIKIL